MSEPVVSEPVVSEPVGYPVVLYAKINIIDHYLI